MEDIISLKHRYLIIYMTVVNVLMKSIFYLVGKKNEQLSRTSTSNKRTLLTERIKK